LPHPEILAGFDTIEAGTAKRIVDQFMDEGSHRHHVEMITIEANVATQKSTSDLAAYKAKAVVRSDTLGQVLATLVCFACIAGAVWLAMLEHHVIAAILAALPTATLVKSFFARRSDKD